jgi:RHS repeat-associated protein
MDFCFSYTLNNLLAVSQKGSAPTDSTKWRTRTFTYDSLSRLVCAANPEIQIATCPASAAGPFPAGVATYTYDADGNTLTKGSPAPNQTSASSTETVTYSYDALNRLTQKSFSAITPLATPTIKYGYDGVAPTGCTPPTLTDSYPKGRRTSMCDASGSTSWKHDYVGRILSESRTIASRNKLTTYTFNLDGSLATLTYPTGRVLTFAYSTAGRALSATDIPGSVTYAQNALYTPTGALNSMQQVKGGTTTTTTNSYNARQQPLLLSAAAPSGTLLSLSYDFHASTHADNGNVFQIVNNRDNNRTKNFLYDSLNRIQQAYTNGSNWGETFGPIATAPGVPPATSGIDAWGNLTNRSGVTGKTAYEPLSVSATTQNHLTGFNYDAAGNMSQNGTPQYFYDAENHMTSASGGYSYIYDGDGNRVEKCTAGTTAGTCAASPTGTLYWTDTGGNNISETDLAGNLQQEYMYFGKRVGRRESNGDIRWYFSDHLGTADVIAYTTGSIKSESDYYPYGGEIPISGSDTNHYKFTGKERDAESGLDDFVARYYTSSLGRFMIPDWSAGEEPVPYATFGNPQSLNLYGYVSNNPTTVGDPDGHDPGSAVAEVEEVVEVVEDLAPEAIEAGEGGSICGPVCAAAAATAVVAVGVGAYEYDKHLSDPGPPASPPTPKPPAITPPATVPSPQMAEHTKGARKSTRGKHQANRSGRPNTKDRQKDDWRDHRHFEKSKEQKRQEADRRKEEKEKKKKWKKKKDSKHNDDVKQI